MPIDPQERQALRQRIEDRHHRQDVEAARHVKSALASAIPARYAQANWTSLIAARPPVPPPVLTVLEEWCANPVANLVIIGSFRVGKTWAAAACLRRVARPGHTLAFWSCSSLLELGRDDARTFSSIMRVRWLVLDDTGTEQPPHAMVQDRLASLVNYRDQQCLPTIVTSCLHPEQLKEWVGARSYERLTVGSRVAWAGNARGPE